MNEYFALLIPIILSIIFVIIYHTKLVWWEIISPTIIGLIIIFTMKSCDETYNISDTEYISNHAVKAVYDEPWDEYINKTCSYTTTSGSGKNKTTTTHYYDCSYVDRHDAEYYITDDDGNSYYISEQKYYNLVKLWNNQHFIELNRNYHHNDGDEYVTIWDNNINNLITTTKTHTYENRVQASHSLYNFKDLTENEKIKYDLYEYPEINGYTITPILSKHINITDTEQKEFNNINGLLGKKKQVHVFLCIFKDKTIESGIKQKQYWKGGNKNELIICVGVDKNNNIKWNYVFSWTEKQLIHIKLRNFINNDKDKKLNIFKIKDYTYNIIDKEWQRTSFSKFKFLDVKLSDTQVIWIYIVVIIVTFGFLIFAIMNDFDANKNNKNNKNWFIKTYYKIKNKLYW